MPKQKAKEVKVPKKRGRPKSKKKLYFGPEVQAAIVKYNESDSPSERNRIYYI